VPKLGAPLDAVDRSAFTVITVSLRHSFVQQSRCGAILARRRAGSVSVHIKCLS
jgi:hypothetical protein